MRCCSRLYDLASCHRPVVCASACIATTEPADAGSGPRGSSRETWTTTMAPVDRTGRRSPRTETEQNDAGCGGGDPRKPSVRRRPRHPQRGLVLAVHCLTSCRRVQPPRRGKAPTDQEWGSRIRNRPGDRIGSRSEVLEHLGDQRRDRRALRSGQRHMSEQRMSLSASITAATPSCRPTRRLSRWATS